jgi:hypothetical protein
MMRRVLCCLVVLAGLGACAPVYETRYQLTPPPGGPESRSCLGRCRAALSLCATQASGAYRACDQRAQQRFEVCQRNASIEVEVCKRSGRDDCTRRICTRERCSDASVAGCDADYRGCFAACGGSVTESAVCVANCP